MPVIGNLGQQGKQGAYEILKIEVTQDKDGLITATPPAAVEKEEAETKVEAKAETENKEGKAK